MKSPNNVPLLLSSVGFGNATLWYFFSHPWIVEGPLGSTAGIVEAGGSNTLPVSFLIAATLAIGYLLHKPLGTRRLVRGAMALMLVCALAIPALAACAAWNLLAPRAFYLAWTAASSVLFGLAHILWIHRPTEQSLRETMVSLSLGLVYAGVAAALFAGGSHALIGWSICAPLASCLSFALAYRGASARMRNGAEAQPADALATAKRIPFVAIYAAIMGFATTQFFILNAPAAQQEIGVATVPLVGMVFLFAGLFMLRTMNVTWFLFLSAVFFATLILLWFVYPGLTEPILGATSSLHWVSFILVACSAHESRLLPQASSASSTYVMLAIYYLASGMGNVAIHLGIASRGLICLLALAILLAAFALARHERGLFAFEGGIAREASERQEAIGLLAARHDLTPRETDVFALLAEGNSLKHIAETLVLSENTVKRHRSNVYAKLQVGSRQELLDIVRQSTAA